MALPTKADYSRVTYVKLDEVVKRQAMAAAAADYRSLSAWIRLAVMEKLERDHEG